MRPYQRELRLRSYGLQICNYRFGIVAIQAKLRHRKAKTIAVGPDAGSQELDHVGIIGGRSAADPRRVDWPVRIGPCGNIRNGSTLEPSSAVQISAVVAWGVALPTDGHVFNEVLSASDVRRCAGLFARMLRLTALGKCRDDSVRQQGKNEESGKRNESKP